MSALKLRSCLIVVYVLTFYMTADFQMFFTQRACVCACVRGGKIFLKECIQMHYLFVLFIRDKDSKQYYCFVNQYSLQTAGGVGGLVNRASFKIVCTDLGNKRTFIVK